MKVIKNWALQWVKIGISEQDAITEIVAESCCVQ